MPPSRMTRQKTPWSSPAEGRRRSRSRTLPREPTPQSSRTSGSPGGAGEVGGLDGYKDFAPDGAFGRSATVSAEPVAVREEDVVNIFGEVGKLHRVNSEEQPAGSSKQQLKRCTKCDQHKQPTEFRHHRSTKDGLQFWCMSCQSKSQRKYLSTTQGRQQQRLAQKTYRKTSGGRETQRKSQSKFNKTPRGKILRLKARSKSRGLSVTISAGDFERWWKESPHVCGYCGCTTEEYRHTARCLRGYEGEKRLLRLLRGKLLKLGTAAYFDLTIDRADNELGYDFGNLVKACWICNSVKGHFLTSHEMKMVGPRIRKEIDAGLAAATP